MAEEQIGEILEQLGEEHLLIHDVQCQFGKIDHIVLSKNHGIFLIETNSHFGSVEVIDSKIRVNGKPTGQDFIARMLRNTHWLAEELETITGVKARVNSLVVFTNAFVVTSRSIKGITITNNKFLLSSIQQLAKPLAPEVWEAKEKIAHLFTATNGLHSH